MSKCHLFHSDSILHIFSLGSQSPENPEQFSVAQEARPPAVCHPREVYFGCEGPTGQMGPQVFLSCWNWQAAACRHPGLQMWGAFVFVFLLIELLMPHLSTSLKQSFLDAFRNLSLCSLSGLVFICGKGELACQEWSKVSCAEVTISLVSCHIQYCSSLQ